MPERTNTLSCPVDFITINEYQVRLVALQVLVAAVVLAVWQPWPLAALLLVDFALRAFDQGKFSPLGWVAKQAVRWLALGHKPVDQAPKRFAARIGLVFSFGILLCIITNNLLPGTIMASTLAVFAWLESFMGFCAGCYVYSWGKKIFPKL